MENNSTKSAPVMRVKEWVIANIIAWIPIVGLIMLLVWAFGGSAAINENKKNWAKALLFIELAVIVLAFLFYGLLAIFALATES